MALYKITIQLLSPIATPLKGDTIWGHIIWGIAYNEGEKSVEEFLERQKIAPEIVISSAFPSGYICRPLPLPKERKQKLDCTEYSLIKKDKKRRYVPASDYLNSVDVADLKNNESPFICETVTHNVINRHTGTVHENGLYSSEQLWASYTDKFDIYIESSLKHEKIHTLFKWAFENGYGADSSIGKGKIEVISDVSLVTPKYNTNKYMALGPFVNSDKIHIENLRADIFTRSGRLGGGFSELSPFKKTVVLFDECAVFDCEEKIAYCGKILTDIHTDRRICQSGFAPVIPINMENN